MGFDTNSLDVTQKVQATKVKADKLDFTIFFNA
jgi:hypothetical protein